MDKKLSFSGLVIALFLAAVAGCNKPTLESKPPAPGQPAPVARRTVAVLHWLGKKQLAAESNATNFMAIWNLPESAQLEAQTLDKLATAPWRLLSAAAPPSNAPTAWLRPLLADLVQEESYVEVQGLTNHQPDALVLALRLDAARAALWQTNLPVILHSIFGSSSVTSSNALDFRVQTSNFSFALSRAGDWTLFAINRSSNDAPAALATFRDRIAATQNPYPPRSTNYWLETDFDLRALGLEGSDFELQTSPSARENLPRINLTWIGDGQNVRTRGWLDFGNPLSLSLPAWNVPSNIIYQPLIGFSAVRGTRPWLESLDFWKEKQLGDAPDQAFFWSQKSAPWLHFFALRSANANHQFLALKDFILETINPALEPNRTGDFAWLTNESRVAWKGVPFCSPTFDLRGDLILGGFSATTASNHVIPSELLQQLHKDSGLIYYDWEVTEEQVAAWTQMSQLMRMAFGYAQLSIKEPGLPWLNVVGPHLGFSATSLAREGDRKIALARTSVLGLSSVELQVFVDWLSSPEFPCGLHTSLAPRKFVKDQTRPHP